MIRLRPPCPSVQVLAFACVGAAGFAVDAGLFWWCYHFWQLDLLTSRLLAFLPATVATWLLNRTLTFKSRITRSVQREYFQYASIQIIGSALNFAVFYALVRFVPVASALPLLPLAVASCIAMGFNYFGAKYLVYKV